MLSLLITTALLGLTGLVLVGLAGPTALVA